MPRPYTIKIFVPAGDPEGIRIIEKSNWSGAGLLIPRPLFPEGRHRREMTRTGVYVLVGPPEESGLPRVYVGEGDPIRPRLEQHAANKDFWTTCFAFTSKDENLNKAHVQFLESRLVDLADKAKRCTLDNGNRPALPSLSESDAAEAEGFLEEALMCFPVLGLGVFSTVALQAPAAPELSMSGRGVTARGFETAEGFVVLTGSEAALDEVKSCYPYIVELRAALAENGVLKAGKDKYVFTQNYVFPSPSSAAGVILGRSVNGRDAWKAKDGRTLNELQAAQASA